MTDLLITNAYIGERIRKVRQQRGFTQKDLAEKLGRTIGAVSQLEKGNTQITVVDLLEIADFLNKPLEYFLGNDFGGDDIQDIVAVVQQMDPEARRQQIPIIKSILSMKQIGEQLQGLDSEDEEQIRSIALDVYDFLIPYIRGINKLSSDAYALKTNLEILIGIEDENIELLESDSNTNLEE